MGGICVSYILFNHITRIRNLIDKNNTNELKLLLSRHPKYTHLKCDREGNSLLFYAINKGKDEIVKLLLEFGADPNQVHPKTQFSPLYAACTLKTHFSDSMNVLSASVSQDLASNDHITVKKIVKFLISHGANVNKVIKINDIWTSPLILAVEHQNYGAIDSLLESNKLNINYQEPINAKTAFHSACLIGNIFLLVKLLNMGANPYLRLKDGNTVIHLLASNSKDDTSCFIAVLRHTKYLINLNTRNSLGQTPLMIAAMRNKKNMLKYLLDNNASLDECDNSGKTVLYYARQSSCLNLLDSFSRMKRIQVKKRSQLNLSKMSLNMDNSNSNKKKFKYLSTHSLVDPHKDNLSVVNEDLALNKVYYDLTPSDEGDESK